MVAPAPVQRFLPGAEASIEVRRFFRAIDLGRHPPQRKTQWAAVVVSARFLLRDRRTERIEISEHLASLGSEPPLPSLEHTPQPVHHRYFENIDAQVHECTVCTMLPGRQLCSTCGGSGRIQTERDEPIACPGCEGSRYLPCSNCDGRGHAVWVDAVYLTDAALQLHRVYFPSALLNARIFEIETALLDFAMPEPLAISLDPKLQRGPYRDAAPRQAVFHGFEYGDALARARAEVEFRLGQRPLDSEVRAYAYPLLELHHRIWGRTFHRLVLVDPDGQPRQWVD